MTAARICPCPLTSTQMTLMTLQQRTFPPRTHTCIAAPSWLDRSHTPSLRDRCEHATHSLLDKPLVVPVFSFTCICPRLLATALGRRARKLQVFCASDPLGNSSKSCAGCSIQNANTCFIQTADQRRNAATAIATLRLLSSIARLFNASISRRSHGQIKLLVS